MIAYFVNQSDPRQLNCRSNIRLIGKFSYQDYLQRDTLQYLHDVHKYDVVHVRIGMIV